MSRCKWCAEDRCLDTSEVQLYLMLKYLVSVGDVCLATSGVAVACILCLASSGAISFLKTPGV